MTTGAAKPTYSTRALPGEAVVPVVGLMTQRLPEGSITAPGFPRAGNEGFSVMDSLEPLLPLKPVEGESCCTLPLETENSSIAARTDRPAIQIVANREESPLAVHQQRIAAASSVIGEYAC